MTCREKLAIEHPDDVREDRIGGCAGCPDEPDRRYLPRPSYCNFGGPECTKCWDREIPEEDDTIEGKFTIAKPIEEENKTTPIPYKPDGEAVPLPYKPEIDEEQPSKLIAQITPKIDISKLIDEAMEKKDRYVTVFVNNEGRMSINVYPYEKDEPRWIPIMDGCGEFAAVSHYECSECGHIKHYCSPYCSMCGEKLKLPDSK